MSGTTENIQAFNLMVNSLEKAQRAGSFTLTEAEALVTAIRRLHGYFSELAKASGEPHPEASSAS